MSRILEEDFEYIKASFPEWKQLKNSTIFITGATGYLGSLIVKALDYISKQINLDLKIIALIRNQEKAEQILNGCNVHFVKGTLDNLPLVFDQIDYVFHCAASTKSKEMIEAPVEVIEGIVNGTQNILKLVREKRVQSMVYLSSMEVYGLTDPDLEYVTEENLGYVDINNVRSCYPLGKRMAENICISYFKEYNIPVKIARLAQTFGAGMLDSETRIFSQFARSVINETNIVLHTDGSSVGNYCYTADAILGLMMLLVNGKNGEIYNITNENTCMTIKQMAELIATTIANNKIIVEYKISKSNDYGYAAPCKMKLSSEKIRNLGWYPKYEIKEMYQRMIDCILEDYTEKSLS